MLNFLLNFSVNKNSSYEKKKKKKKKVIYNNANNNSEGLYLIYILSYPYNNIIIIYFVL